MRQWYFFYQGIEWTAIDYFNNAIICDLVEKVSVGNKYLTVCLLYSMKAIQLEALITFSPVLFFQCVMIQSCFQPRNFGLRKTSGQNDVVSVSCLRTELLLAPNTNLKLLRTTDGSVFRRPKIRFILTCFLVFPDSCWYYSST